MCACVCVTRAPPTTGPADLEAHDCKQQVNKEKEKKARKEGESGKEVKEEEEMKVGLAE